VNKESYLINNHIREIMKVLGRLANKFRAAVERAKQQNVAVMNPEKREEYCSTSSNTRL